MIKNVSRQMWLVAALTIAIIILLVVIWLRSGPISAEGRYQLLKQACVDSYNEDMKKGISYIRYPCEAGDIKGKYKDKYGEDYAGAIAN